MSDKTPVLSIISNPVNKYLYRDTRKTKSLELPQQNHGYLRKPKRSNTRKKHILKIPMRSNIRSKSITKICSNAGECMAIGRENDTIIEYFDGFTNFDYIKVPIIRIGKPSNNGFIHRIQYMRNGYSCYAILKSSQSAKADNLAYEYLVGQFINKQSKRFPCFVETYGFFYYKDVDSWNNMRMSLKMNDKTLFSESLMKIESGSNSFLKLACRIGERAALLIQDIPKSKALYDMLKPSIEPVKKVRIRNKNYNVYDDSFVENDLRYILFQVYFPLAALSSLFTHYDLHGDNVLVYELENQTCIEYRYHFYDGTSVSFKSKYIAKIIDYGRCYFLDTEAKYLSESESLEIYENICKLSDCGDCGNKKGFGWMTHPKYNSCSNYYINSNVVNTSHDIRLIKIISDSATQLRNTLDPKSNYLINVLDEDMQNLLVDIVYDETYGSRPRTSSYNPSHIWSKKIQTVDDVIKLLRNSVNNPESMNQNGGNYSGMNCIGVLDIYDNLNRDMKFTPT
jgi:hypothetical protein